jgi:hypothetical protein
LAIGVSVLLHAVLFLVWRIESRAPDVPRRRERIVVLQPLEDSLRVMEMPYRVPRTEVSGRQPLHPPRPRRLPEEPPVPSIAEIPRIEIPSDTTHRPQPAGPGGVARIGADLGTGALWVRPLPLPPRELAQRLHKSHAELTDSAVKATVQAFLDSIAKDPASATAAMPSWTTDLGGKKFGLDQKYLYIAGLKIPAAVLALLPISGGTNQLKAFDRTNDLLIDLRTAANRAATVSEFKDAIKDMRRRKDEEREFQRNQRNAPPTDLRTKPPADTTRARAPHDTMTS